MRIPTPWPPVLALLAIGCVPPEGDSGSLDLWIRPIEASDGWQLEVVNDGDESYELGCNDFYCESPAVRYEAQQADGSWVERGSWTRFERALNRPSTLDPRDSLLLGHGETTFADLDDVPGLYRIVVRARRADGGARDVTLEYAVQGWAPEVLEASDTLRDQADIAVCTPLVRQIDDALIRRLEPDALIDLYWRRPDLQGELRFAMLERGGFSIFLRERLLLASMNEVREVAEWLGRQADEIQVTLRPIAAARLTDPLGARTVILPLDDYRLIQQLADHWETGVPERLVARLESGPERGEALVALLDVFSFTPTTMFESFEGRVRAALPGRCDGASDEAHVESCGRVEALYDPERSGFGFGRGFGSASHCFGFGGALLSETCAQLEREWDSLSSDAGDAELVWLSGELIDGR